MAEKQDAATIDKLTGVANRQSAAGGAVLRGRTRQPLQPAVLGRVRRHRPLQGGQRHATATRAGDIVLRGVAQTIHNNLRGTDLIGRYGGEEFMLLLSETNVEDAATLAEKLRNLVQRQTFDVEGNAKLNVTVSIGIAGGQGAVLRVDALARDADAAMYSAKSLGRNQVYVFAEPDDDARIPRAPDLAGGPGAWRSRSGGSRARPRSRRSPSLIAPLPHYRGQPSALIASIAVRMATSSTCPKPRSNGSGSPRSSTTSARWPSPRRSSRSRPRSRPPEWRTVVQHPRIGQVIIEQATAFKDAIPIILHHHERYSGHGYPFGLRANDIPLGARIVAIADAYDAMTHDRPYKRAVIARHGDQGAAPPRRDAVRPGARGAVLRPLRDAGPGGGRDRRDPDRSAAAERSPPQARRSFAGRGPPVRRGRNPGVRRGLIRPARHCRAGVIPG